MRDFEVSFERVSLICDNTSKILVAKNSVFHRRMRQLERRHHFLRDHIEKGGIEIRYIDTERQLIDIFIKSLILLALLTCDGKLVFAILITLFDGEFVLYLLYCIFYFSLIFSLKDWRRRSDEEECEPIKIFQWNLAYIPKST
jgi:hypothetical protein